MDERIRVRTYDRCATRSADPSRSYPRDERRVLSPEALQGPATAPARSGSQPRCRSRYRRNPRSLILSTGRWGKGGISPLSPIDLQYCRWPTFPPPRWPAFAPPLTAAFEARINQAPCTIADRLWVKHHLDQSEEKLRFS